MSTATTTRLTSPTRRVSPGVRLPTRPGSPRGPLSRPSRTVPAPAVFTGQRAAVRACRVEAASAQGDWRLTDRGIAVVLVLLGMIAVAAVAVVGLTAWQVTGADYANWSAQTVRVR